MAAWGAESGHIEVSVSEAVAVISAELRFGSELLEAQGAHLANLAEVKGYDLARSTVKKILVAAEPLSPVKRQKLERAWGAEVFDHFGMTEAALVSAELGPDVAGQDRDVAAPMA